MTNIIILCSHIPKLLEVSGMPNLYQQRIRVLATEMYEHF